MKSVSLPRLFSNRPISIFFVCGLFCFGVMALAISSHVFAIGPSTYYVASNGSDARTCTNATTDACKTIDRAYHLAAPGDSILVADGSYGPQSLTPKSSAVSPNIIVSPASGATVNMTSLSLDGSSYLTFQGNFRITNSTGNSLYISGEHPISYVTIDGFTMSGAYGTTNVVQFEGNSNHITIRNSDIAYNTDSKLIQTDNYAPAHYPNGSPPNQNIVIEYNKIHDQNQSNNTIHMECLYIGGVYGFTLRGNLIYGCRGTGDMIFSLSGTVPQDPRDYLIENNYWGQGHDATNNGLAYSIQGCAPTLGTGTKYAYNIFETEAVRCGEGDHVTYVGNIGYHGSCGGSTTYKNNIWSSLRCSGDKPSNSAILASGNFVNAAARDFRPKTSSSPQVDMGDLSDYPSKDALGLARYSGAGPDAGPYEYGATNNSGPKAGDFNGDGFVDNSDVDIFKASWDSRTATAQDLNSDGVVNVIDLSVLLSAYGT